MNYNEAGLAEIYLVDPLDEPRGFCFDSSTLNLEWGRRNAAYGGARKSPRRLCRLADDKWFPWPNGPHSHRSRKTPRLHGGL